MSFDYRKLKGRIVEIFDSQQAFSKAMGWSERTCSLKMNGVIFWKQNEIEKARVLLGLEKEDIPVYFFTLKV